MDRPNPDIYGLLVAHMTALRGTCSRKRVGCVLVNEHREIIATGYNGPPRHRPHCTRYPCPGALLPRGQGLATTSGLCQAVHAEANAVLQCRDIHQIDTLYVTTSPCLSCVNLLLNTSTRRIVFDVAHAHHDEAEELWRIMSREWVHIPLENTVWSTLLSTIPL